MNKNKTKSSPFAMTPAFRFLKRTVTRAGGVSAKGIAESLLLFFLFQSGILFANPVTIEGTITNGSTGKPVPASNLSLYTMDDAMNLVGRITNASVNFRFQTEATSETFLLTGEYNRQVFFQTAKPGEKLAFQVYDPGAKAEEIQITSMHLVNRTGESLQVESMYVISNQSSPARTFQTGDLEFLLPKGASSVESFMRLENASLAVPLDLENTGEDSYKINMSIRPGNSTLTFRYLIKGSVLRDSMPGLRSSGALPELKPFRIVSWKPVDSVPEVKGAAYEEITVPHLGRAFRVNYTNGKTVAYDFSSGGKQAYSTAGNIHKSPIPGEWVGGLVALAMAVSILFLAINLYAAQGRKTDSE